MRRWGWGQYPLARRQRAQRKGYSPIHPAHRRRVSTARGTSVRRMVLQTAVPREVTADRRELLALHTTRLVDRAGGDDAVMGHTIVAIGAANWAADALPEGVGWATETDRRPSWLFAADCLRSDAARIADEVTNRGPGARLVFSEIESVVGRFGRPVDLPDVPRDGFDTTATLWQNGLTVIDVDRREIRVGHMRWHLVAGIARLTPSVVDHGGAD